MSSPVTLSEYLFIRLRQLGVGAIHGVPGDYNLTLLDYVEPAGLLWVGNANELNAGYAADGYARIKGVGALITTFGVGELSAINAIAGAYAERAAVVHIVGTPARALQDSRALVHHTFNDGNYRRFGQMHAHVTVAQASLRDPRTSPEQIDEVLRQCILHSRPVYIEVPVDMVSSPVSAERLNTPITIPKSEPTEAHDLALKELLNRISTAKQPIILVDGEIRAFGITNEVQKVVDKTQWPTWTSTFAKGLLDETRSNHHGIYEGDYDASETRDFINNADLVLCFGPHFSWTNSYGFTSIPKNGTLITISDTEIKIGHQIFRDIPASTAISRLLQDLESSKAHKYNPYPSLPRDKNLTIPSNTLTAPITQDKLWRILGSFLRPGDIVLGETGTAGYGCRQMSLPPQTRVFTPVTWLSIGYMLPATQGAALAQRELIKEGKYNDNKDARTILFIGDGSFQMTAQELGTIIRHNLNVVLFLINNDGYTIERCIHGLRQGYNDVAEWRYLQAPSFFGAKEGGYTGTAKTWGELETVLGNKEVISGEGLRMVEVFVDKEDAPKGPLLQMMGKQKELVGK
ncbi:thiamine pyrophosphate enzyme [Dendryphion nanum]|uniref:Pyruvate decarboxylase n=1 Tax=Dendryphion nanum TaxID=256645 RepID=A0A9P9DTF8_9PLEO|nr:thiamine pyrophosphate enzyme [Dendryphion nanum]